MGQLNTQSKQSYISHQRLTTCSVNFLSRELQGRTRSTDTSHKCRESTPHIKEESDMKEDEEERARDDLIPTEHVLEITDFLTVAEIANLQPNPSINVRHFPRKEKPQRMMRPWRMPKQWNYSVYERTENEKQTIIVGKFSDYQIRVLENPTWNQDWLHAIVINYIVAYPKVLDQKSRKDKQTLRKSWSEHANPSHGTSTMVYLTNDEDGLVLSRQVPRHRITPLQQRR